MPIRVLPVLVFVTLLACGCVSTLRVCEDTSNDPDAPSYESLPGLPFFGKKEVYRQVTKKQTRWRTVSLVAPGEASDAVLLSVRTELAEGPELILARLAVATYDGSLAALGRVVFAMSELPPAASSSVLVSNQISARVVPDASRPFFLNAPLPWFGSATVSGEIGADGTLSEASATVDPGVEDLLSDVIPLGDLLGDALALDTEKLDALGGATAEALDLAEALETDGELPLPAKLRLNERIEGYEDTYEFDHAQRPSGALEDLSQRRGPVSHVRRALGASSKPSTDPAKTVRVSGSVVLP